MKVMTKNGFVSPHTVSTVALVALYKAPVRGKDKQKIVAALRSRGVDVRKHLFVETLSGTEA